MFTIERARPDDWSKVREVRLAALSDTPDAFWATYEGEVDKPEGWWRDFIDKGAWFLAVTDGAPVGVAAMLNVPDADHAERHLISMWVAPVARARGIGAALVEAVIVAAKADGAAYLQLEVTDGNTAARALYERCGFEPTGASQYLPHKPHILEHEMRLLLHP